jgi:hypothetical protein
MAALLETLRRLGLREKETGESETSRNFALACQFKIDLVMALLGVGEKWDIALTLEDYSYFDESEADDLWACRQEEFDVALRKATLRAYYDFSGGASKSH